MDLGITSDAWWECQVGETMRGMRLNEDFIDFLPGDYGDRIANVFVVFNCHDSSFNYKKRIRLDASRKILYMDIMLDFELMRNGGVELRRKHLLEMLALEVPAVVARYDGKNCFAAKFGDDFRKWISEYPIYSLPMSEKKLPDMRLDPLEEKNGEFLKIVIEEFSCIASEWQLSSTTETKGPTVHSVKFSDGVKSIAVYTEYRPQTLAIMPSELHERLSKARILLFQYVLAEEDGLFPLMSVKIGNNNETEIARIDLKTPGDFRIALRAVADVIKANPQILFRESRARRLT